MVIPEWSGHWLLAAYAGGRALFATVVGDAAHTRAWVELLARLVTEP